MNIVYVIEKMSGKGGMERILTEKINYLAEDASNKVAIILLWHDEQSLAFPLSEKVEIVRLNAPYGNPVIGFPILWWRFKKEIKRINPDITIYTWIAGAFLACYSGWKGKSIFENHHTLSDMRHSKLIEKASRKVDCIVTLTKYDAEAFHNAKRLEIIPNFTSLKGTAADYSLRHCLAIGRFVAVKDFPRMIMLWKQVIEKHPNWILDIVGEGAEETAIRNIITENNLQGNIVLHPATNDVSQYYANSSIYLLTSKSEGLPMVLLEAQTCGLPIVAFDCPYGPREIIEDSKTGYLIQYDNDEALVEKLSALIDDEALRQSMGKTAQIASKRFDKETIMARWQTLFNSLVNPM